MDNIAMKYWLFVGLLFVILHSLQVYADVCEGLCKCSNTNTSRIVDCHRRQSENSSQIYYSLPFDRDSTVLNLSENGISALPINVFENLERLEVLDLSQNQIHDQSLSPSLFNDMKQLVALDLSHNILTILKQDVISQISSLEKLNLSHNHLHSLDPTIGETLTKLTHLTISHNNFTFLNDESLKSFTNLKYLDISSNSITSLGVNNLAQLNQLTTLHLNNNKLDSSSFKELPTSISQLNAGYNMFTDVPYDLKELKVLNIEYNKITELDLNKVSFSQMEILNTRGNKLSSFPNVEFEKLLTLDLSYNNLLSIPDTLKTENLPKLVTLVISGNPIRELQFYSKLRLPRLVARSLNMVQSIEKNAFVKLENTTCTDLTVSQCKSLSYIHEEALDNITLCSLDLSDNNLTSISSKLVKSGKLLKDMDSINLQGNPFHCNCTLQWIISDLVPWLYSTKRELLENLECASPPELKEQRMVHWYNQPTEVLCEETSSILQPMIESTKTITLSTSTGMLAALICAGVVLLTLVIIGVVLAQRIAVKRSRRNRRF